MSKIKIDTDRTLGQIDENIFGGFAEHLGKCVYKGIYDENNPLSDKNGFRTDVMEALQRLGMPNLRWPGGNFVSGYHWMDGIGPMEKRRPMMELAWHTVEPNTFGTDEFLKYCKVFGTQPYIAVNMGTGTIDEARAWLEYVNVDKATYYADLRRKNGHEEPYHVKYWGLGNEVNGDWQIGHKDAGDYAKEALELAKLMKWTDPSIKLIASGFCYHSSDAVDWDKTVLEKMGSMADYIALHMYIGDHDGDYYKYMANGNIIEKRIRAAENVIDMTSYKQNRKDKVKICFDEWNASYTDVKCGVKERFKWEDALIDAMYINSFIRHADSVKMADIAQVVNLLGPVMSNENGIFLQTIFYPIEKFYMLNSGKSLDLHVETNGYEDKDFGYTEYLDSSASYDESKKRITLNLVNKRLDLNDTVTVNLQNKDIESITGYTLNANSVYDFNSFDKEECVAQNTFGVYARNAEYGKVFDLSLPPHSVCFAEIKLK